MITRPLDLAAKLRPPPRNFDFVFLVNGGLIVMFFMLFGSRFVLAPGLGVDFIMPEMPGAVAGAARTTHVVSVIRPGLIFVDDGAINFEQLKEWLKVQAKTTPQPSLLVPWEMTFTPRMVTFSQRTGLRIHIGERTIVTPSMRTFLQR